MKQRVQRRVRIVGCLLVLAVGAALLVPALSERRTERRIRHVLLVLQEALQRYHVKEEEYPKARMSGRELVIFLSEGGHLSEELENPWTKELYQKSGDPDHLRYRTDSLAETYELSVLIPGTDEVKFRLDSTSHQSLE